MMLRCWATGGVSVIGPLHIRENLPNQDYWLGKEYSWGSVLVVSDGLGSKPYSDIGSKAACESVVEIAEKWDFDKDFDQVRFTSCIHSEWLRRISPLRAEDCSATCLFAIQVGCNCFLGKLGDGLICIGNRISQSYLEMGDIDDFGFSNLTSSLGPNNFHSEWQNFSLKLSNYDFIFICTDGISDDLKQESKMSFVFNLVNEYRTEIIQSHKIKEPEWLLNWPVRGHTDDKTFAIMILR